MAVNSDNIKSQMRKGFLEYCILLILKEKHRSEERRVGKECLRQWRSGGSSYHEKESDEAIALTCQRLHKEIEDYETEKNEQRGLRIRTRVYLKKYT